MKRVLLKERVMAKILVVRQVKEKTLFRPKVVQVEWENKTFECEKCRCHFELLELDENNITAVLVEEVDESMGKQDFVVYRFRCPETGCSNLVELGYVPASSTDYEEIKQYRPEPNF